MPPSLRGIIPVYKNDPTSSEKYFKKVFGIYLTIKYHYNAVDSLVLIETGEYNNSLLDRLTRSGTEDKIEFIYKNGLLTEKRENNTRKYFDKNKNVIEEIIYGTDKLQWRRWAYKFNDENNLVEAIEFNNANEPSRQFKYSYEYQ